MNRLALAAFCVAILVGVSQSPAQDPVNAVKPLEKTLRIEFTLEPKEGDDPVLYTLCALEEYKLGASYRNTDIDFDIGIAGTIQESADGRYLLVYNSKMIYVDENTGEEAEFDVHGSARVKSNRPKSLGVLGDRTLTVQLIEQDDQDRAN